MGDRCYVHGYVRKTDWTKFADICDIQHDFDNEPAHYPGLVHFEDDERNYGMYDELFSAADAGCRFVVYNSAGDSYGPGVTAADGTAMHTATTNENGTIHVAFAEDNAGDGTVLEQDVTNARTVAAAIYQVLHGTSHDAPAKTARRTSAKEVVIE